MASELIEHNRLRSWLRHKGRMYMVLYALLLPTFLGMALFNYYPKFETIQKSFYIWDGSSIEEFSGLKNYIDIFTADPQFLNTFKLAGILLVANLFKMWPCIIIAIVLHRIRSERWRYIYRVLFVIPMVIPSLVWLLIWKSFYDPTSGILNRLLNTVGLMGVLQWLDTAMPQLATTLSPVNNTVGSIFGNIWGMGAWSLLVLASMGGAAAIRRRVPWLVILSVAFLCANAFVSNGEQIMLSIFGLFHGGVGIAVALAMGVVLSRSYAGESALKWIGGLGVAATVILIFTTMIWTSPTNAFNTGMPAWLGHSKLVIPAIIFWGFPWVGTIGVLIYLAGLQGISGDVYEAGELDGVGPIRKMFSLELPLIMTQVRINLIFMTIATLNQYGMFLLLLGPHGGPDNKGLVPGLYMYRKAFIDQQMGYACALGMVMFALILCITIFYQKYVKVEK